MKIYNLTYLFAIVLLGLYTGVKTYACTPKHIPSDTTLIFADPIFQTDSSAIEQAAQTFIQKKTAKNLRYYRKLEATNALFLKKLRRQEERLVVKLRTDSLKYQQYLALKSPDMDSLIQQTKDTGFLHKLAGARHKGKSGLDSLLKLQNYIGAINTSSKAEAINFTALEQKAALQDYLQKQVAARTGVLDRLLKGTKLESYCDKLNNTGKQYQQQAGYWKNILDHPDEAETKALDYLRGIKGFEQQLNSNQQAGNGISGKSAAELEALGYQTKAKVGEQLQQQFGNQLAGISQQAGEQLKQYTKALDKPLKQINQAKQAIGEGKQKLDEGQNSVQSAKNSLNKLKPTGFRNPMRGIPFWQRWETQYNFQTQRASADGSKPVMLQTGLNLSYRQSKALSLGIGIDGSLGLGSNWQHLRLSYEGIVGRIFLDYKLLWGISLQGGYEKSLRPINRAYTQVQEQFGNTSNVKTAMGLLQDAAYLGVMKSYRINPKLQGTFLVGYNFLNDKTKINSPWIIRLGWML